MGKRGLQSLRAIWYTEENAMICGVRALCPAPQSGKGIIPMKTIVSTQAAPAAIGPYSQGTAGGGLVITSGQLPIDPATGAFAPGGIAEQTRQSLKNVQAVLEAAGSGMEKVLKTTVFLSDMENFAAMNEVYGEFFPQGSCPARSAVEVARLPKDALVEIEAIALG